MNWEDILNRMVQAQRDEQMKTSAQLTLGELILLLEAIQDKSKPVIFDDPAYHPSNIASWRGSYAELALHYKQTGKPLTVTQTLTLLKDAVGRTFMGYKGGEYLMGKTTPVWVANYGDACGFHGNTQAVRGVSQDDTHVILVTQRMES